MARATAPEAFACSTNVPTYSSALLRPLGTTKQYCAASATMCGGAKSNTLRRAGSKAATATSQPPAFAPSIRLVSPVYSMNRTGTPALSAGCLPSSTVVPPNSPLESFEPITGLPVNTATRSVPLGARSNFAICVGAGPGGPEAQPAIKAAATMRVVRSMCGRLVLLGWLVEPLQLRVDRLERRMVGLGLQVQIARFDQRLARSAAQADLQQRHAEVVQIRAQRQAALRRLRRRHLTRRIHRAREALRRQARPVLVAVENAQHAQRTLLQHGLARTQRGDDRALLELHRERHALLEPLLHLPGGAPMQPHKPAAGDERERVLRLARFSRALH